MKKKANELIFISKIKRDGSGVVLITPEMQLNLETDKFIDDEFEINTLSLSNSTFIASGFNSYVVKLK